MRKGFTLIELAIALMVIGLILGMALKSRVIVDSAEISSDLNRVNKVQAAITTFYSKYNRLPGDNTTDGAGTFTMEEAYDELVGEGLLSSGDFIVNLEGSNKYFQLVACKTEAEGTIRSTSMDYSEYPNVCVVVTSDEPSENSSTSAPTDITVSKFACYAEQRFDDKDLSLGTGVGATNDTYDFTTCEEAEDVENYTYVIF